MTFKVRSIRTKLFTVMSEHYNRKYIYVLNGKMIVDSISMKDHGSYNLRQSLRYYPVVKNNKL